MSWVAQIDLKKKKVYKKTIAVVNNYFLTKKASKGVYIDKMIVVGNRATQETFRNLNL